MIYLLKYIASVLTRLRKRRTADVDEVTESMRDLWRENIGVMLDDDPPWTYLDQHDPTHKVH